MGAVRACIVCLTPFRGQGSRCEQHRRPGWTNTTPMGPGWSAIRARVLREEPDCRTCGAPAVTVDHILARAFGGTNDRANLQSLCRTCAKRKDHADAEAGKRRARGDGRNFTGR